MDSCWHNNVYRYNGYKSFDLIPLCCGLLRQQDKLFRKEHYYNADKAFVQDSSMIKIHRLKLLTEDMSLRHEYINYIYAYRATLFIYYQPPISKLQRQGQNLMGLIRKYYGEE